MKKKTGEPIGVCNALLTGIKTTVDGSVNITISVNPEDTQLLNKLMNRFLQGEKLVTVAFVSTPEDV